MELLEGYEFQVESPMIAFDLAATSRIVRTTEDKFNSIFLCFSFEDLDDELFSIIEINFTRNSSVAKCPTKSIDC